MSYALIVHAVLCLVIVVIIAKNIFIVRQEQAMVVERLGAYHATWGMGLHFKIPFLERVARTVMLNEQRLDSQPHPVVTRDDHRRQVDTVVYYKVVDPKQYTYSAKNPLEELESLTATKLSNIIGEMELDRVRANRDEVSAKLYTSLEKAAEPLGLKVCRVELKNIEHRSDRFD